MALAERFDELLDRVTCATGETAGPKWDLFRMGFIEEIRKLEDRLVRLEKAESRQTLKLPAK